MKITTQEIITHLKDREIELSNELTGIKAAISALSGTTNPQPQIREIKVKKPKGNTRVYMSGSDKANLKAQILETLTFSVGVPLSAYALENHLHRQFNTNTSITALSKLLGQMTAEQQISYKKTGNKYVYFMPKSAN